MNKNAVITFVIAIVGVVLSINTVQAQKVFTVKYESQADVKSLL